VLLYVRISRADFLLMYDYLVVGAGLFGSVFSHEAVRNGKKVLIIDKRGHIGGNCYTETRDGIDVHKYGPHIFHTSDERIWNFMCQFTEFNGFRLSPKVKSNGKIYSFPINLMTLHQVWGVTSPEEAIKKLEEVRIPCDNPDNLEDWILSQVGREIYEIFIKGYTSKQWMRDPKKLPASIIKRIPIRLTFDDGYFDDTYQGIPRDGYTKIFENMTQGCDIALGEDYFNNRERWHAMAKNVVYTGKIDEFFDYRLGELEYRSLRFEEFKQPGDFQGNAVINYPDSDVSYTRITEHKHFTPERLSKLPDTIYMKEYPIPWNRDETPYYPIGDEKNTKTYKGYRELAEKETNVIFGGRLAEYKYYDMHQIVGSALQKSKKIL
jgi:UDP-galactopyranose mutase